MSRHPGTSVSPDIDDSQERPQACAVSVIPEAAWLMERPEKVAMPPTAFTGPPPTNDPPSEEVSVMGMVAVVTSSPKASRTET